MAGPAVTKRRNWQWLSAALERFGSEFKVDGKEFRREGFVRLVPTTRRPCGKLYVY